MTQSWCQQIFYECKKSTVLLIKRETFYWKKKTYERWIMILKIQSLYGQSKLVLVSNSIKIGLPLKELQETRDTLNIKRKLKNLWEDCCCCYFIYFIIFIMHGKHIAREAYLESPQKYMMELFEKELMILSLKLFSQKKLYHRCLTLF